MDVITKALLTEFVEKHDLAELPEDKQFEHFAAYSVVSSRYSEEFSTDDIVVGGGNDLGIDAFALIVNGRLIDDEQEILDILELNGYLEVEFIFVQAKRSSSFDGASVITLCQNLRNGIFVGDTGLPKSNGVRAIEERTAKIYAAAAKLRGNPECRIYYVTTGNWQEDPYLRSIIDRQVQELEATNMFKQVRFNPIGAQQLQRMYRDTKYSMSRHVEFRDCVVLPAIEKVQASYLGFLPASEFLKLITDEEDNMIKSIFIDNVRDFQGNNPVNKEISSTIDNGFLDQFVLRNNGVTIVARDLAVTRHAFTIRDYQIVNGCQTSHVLYAHRDRISAGVFVPVKLIFTEDEEVTQEVIKSTNRQTPIEENDLLAFTKFQRDLEDYYAGFPEDKRLYYERRSKQYASRTDVEKSRIITVGIQLKVFASMFLDTPHQAGRYQGTLLKAVKDRVFVANQRPESYYTAAFAWYRFEAPLRRGLGGTADLRSFKFHFLMAFRFRYETMDVPAFDHKNIATYCGDLNAILWDATRAREAFESCADIIRRAAASRGLDIVRDSAKVRDLTDAVRDLATAENPRTATTAVP